jgi:hypothetical protein
MAKRRRKQGPQGGATPTGASAPPARGPARPDQPGQIGRRPSSPGFLTLVGLMWVGVGVIIFVTMSWSWRLVPAILAGGIGFLFLRGAARTVIRRDERQTGDGGA